MGAYLLDDRMTWAKIQGDELILSLDGAKEPVFLSFKEGPPDGFVGGIGYFGREIE
jgi:hypothetical protein